MKIRKSVILFLMIIMSGIIFNNTYALALISKVDTINIKNVNADDNIYILLKDDIEDINNMKGLGFYEFDKYMFLNKKPIEKINKNVVFIEERYVENKLPKQLKDTKQKIKIQENNYIKIKVSKDIAIAWQENSSEYDAMKENVLIAKIDKDKANIIDISNIETNHYECNRKLKNIVYRKAMEYDAISDKLIDITTEKTKMEEKFAIEWEEKEEKIWVLRQIIFRILLFASIVLVIIIIFAIISKNIKKRKDNQ